MMKWFQDLWTVFTRRPLKEIIFGKKVMLSPAELEMLHNLPPGTRTGAFVKLDPVHKGKGTAYLVDNTLIFGPDFSVVPGPDLWVYLSTSDNPKKDIGEYFDLGLLKGTKGSQAYATGKPARELGKYQTVLVYCKQFTVLFSYAALK